MLVKIQMVKHRWSKIGEGIGDSKRYCSMHGVDVNDRLVTLLIRFKHYSSKENCLPIVTDLAESDCFKLNCCVL